MKMSVYPEHMCAWALHPENAGSLCDSDATGSAASLTCGAVVRFALAVDAESGTIRAARFKAAGCGYLVAAAQLLTEAIAQQRIATIGASLIDGSILAELQDRLQTSADASRQHCIEQCIGALVNCVAAYHDNAIGNWHGSDALVCSCFFVLESTLDQLLSDNSVSTISDITAACGAGGGCGSCRSILQVMLDERA